MADESQYSSDTYSNKRKYEEPTAPPPSTRRPTGFSSGPIPSASVDPTAPTGLPPSSYNSVPPPMDEIQIAKQKAQEIAARLLNSADAKRPRVDNGASYDYGDNKGFSSYPSGSFFKISFNFFCLWNLGFGIENLLIVIWSWFRG